MIKINLSPEPRVLRQFAWVGLFGLPLLTAFVVKTARGQAWSDVELWSDAAVLAVLSLAAVALIALELGSGAFREAWRRYAQWLVAPTADATEEGDWVWPVRFDAQEQEIA